MLVGSQLFNFSGQEELEFDPNDLDNIEMLQVRVIMLPRAILVFPGCLDRLLASQREVAWWETSGGSCRHF